MTYNFPWIPSPTPWPPFPYSAPPSRAFPARPQSRSFSPAWLLTRTSSAPTSAPPPLSLSIAPTFTRSPPPSSLLSWPLFPSSSSQTPLKAPYHPQPFSPPPSPRPSFISRLTLAKPLASNFSGLFQPAASPWTGSPLSISGSSQFSSPEFFSLSSAASSPKKSAPAAKAPAAGLALPWSSSP